jgi:hypothetical protein
MHIRITFSSNYYIFILVLFRNIITYLDGTFKEEQNDINFKMKFIKSVMPKRLKMLTGIMHKCIELIR